MKHGKVSALSLLLCAMAPLVQAQTHSKLFVPNASLDQTPVARIAGNDPSVMREKAVSINFQALLNAADQANKTTASVPEQLDIELFDGQILTVSKIRVDQRSPKDYTWYGEVKGATMGQAIFTVVNGYLSGNMSIVGAKASQNGSYKIQSNAQGQHFLRQIDQSKFPQEHPSGTVPHVAPPSPAKNSGTKKNLADGGVTKIDVMVLYSNNTATAAGAAIDSEIQQAIDSTNASYQNSGIPTRIRLAHAERANYTESGSFETDLALLSTAGVDTMRNAYGADLVTMLIENPQYCGLAAAIGAQVNTAFAVINRGCASSNLSFAHELGHLYGARHDTLVDPSSTPKQYAHGYINTAAKWRTVMAYNNACANAGVNCTRIPYFSTPLLSNNGAPLGTASVSDNVRVHNEGAATLASFRASKAPEDTGIFNASINNYSITQTSTGFTVTDNVGKDGSVNFSSIFRLKFSDASVALDINANAGQIYRLYRAAFNRIPDLGGIGYWLKSMDGGGTLEGTAGAFIASAEFISLYGANPSDATFINLLYANVLHRSPDQGGYDYWLARLAAGMTRPAVLVSFSESAENKNQVAAALSHGIVYIPYQAAFAANNGALQSPFSKSGK